MNNYHCYSCFCDFSMYLAFILYFWGVHSFIVYFICHSVTTVFTAELDRVVTQLMLVSLRKVFGIFNDFCRAERTLWFILLVFQFHWTLAVTCRCAFINRLLINQDGTFRRELPVYVNLVINETMKKNSWKLLRCQESTWEEMLELIFYWFAKYHNWIPFVLQSWLLMNTFCITAVS